MEHGSISGRMAGEQFHIADAKLSFQTDMISFTLKPGEVKEGAFPISGEQDRPLDGFVSSSRLSMKVLTPEFSGTNDVISYRFDATPFADGDVVEGFFRIISCIGEYRLPFRVEIKNPILQSSLGEVTNLFQFANLAKSNFTEAAVLFAQPTFPFIFAPEEVHEKEWYRGLSKDMNTAYRLEEFLITIGKKQPVTYLSETKEIKLEVTKSRPEVMEYRFKITRNGWGYTHLTCQMEGAFLSSAQKEISEGEFLGNQVDFRFRVDPALLHGGRNYGGITFTSPFQTIRIPVEVLYETTPAALLLHRKEEQQILLRMMQYYEDYRAKKMNSREWLSQTGVLIERMAVVDRSNPVTALYQVHLLLTSGRRKEASYALDRINRKMAGVMPGDSIGTDFTQSEIEDDVTYCYRQYLCALCMEDDIAVCARAAREVEERLKKEPSNWRIAWLLMYLSNQYLKRPSARWNMLRSQFEYGSRSPILYIEAYHLIALNPAIVTRLDDFEVQTLLYAAKKNILTAAVMTQVNYLAQRQRIFSEKLYRILVVGYELEECRVETLESICSLLIKGNLTESRYFAWYSKGVEAKIHLTRLFEYYMLSLPEDYEGEIPQMILMYFAYQSTLPYEKNAYLYCYMHEHRGEYPELYEHYLPDIQRFTRYQISLHRMNSNLCYLYQNYLDEKTFTPEVAADVVPILFMCAVRTTRMDMKEVILLYNRCVSEQHYPINDGICYLPIYGEENHIFFADAQGNRYVSSVAYTCDRLMPYESMAKLVSPYDTGNFGFEMYLSGLTSSVYKVTEQNQQRFLRLADSDEFLPKYRQEIRMKLLHYYNEADCIRELDSYLAKMEPEQLNATDRNDLIQFLILRGINEKALTWVRRYGTYGIPVTTLVRLCTRVLGRDQIAEDPEFAEIVHTCFLEGKYDENMLVYLEHYFDGLIEELEEVRVALMGFGVPHSFLAGRMLIQMLYSGMIIPKQDEILEEYIAGGADSMIVSRVLAQSSHYAFVYDREIGDSMYERIGAMGRNGMPLLDICRMAYLKDLAKKSGEFGNKELDTIRLFLMDLLEQDIVFPFFRRFIGLMPQLMMYADQTLLQYRGKSGRTVLYHYAFESENGMPLTYQVKQMREMYEGVYVTGFILFFGEQLRYYITDDADEKNTVESGTIGQDSRISEDSTDRFGQINRISTQVTLKDYEGALANMETYDYTAHLVTNLFHNARTEE